MIEPKPKNCYYNRRHNQKIKSQRLLYHQKKCNIYICSECIKRCVMENQKKENVFLKISTLKINEVQLYCGCAVDKIQIMEFLNFFCMHCKFLIKNIYYATIKKSGVVHLNCDKLYKNKSKKNISNSGKNFKKKSKSQSDNKIMNHSNMDLNNNLNINASASLEQGKQPYITYQDPEQSQKSISSQVEQRDAQFYPPKQEDLLINILQNESELQIQCYLCKYAVKRDKLYPTDEQQSKYQKNTALLCFRCQLIIMNIKQEKQEKAKKNQRMMSSGRPIHARQHKSLKIAPHKPLHQKFSFAKTKKIALNMIESPIVIESTLDKPKHKEFQQKFHNWNALKQRNVYDPRSIYNDYVDSPSLQFIQNKMNQRSHQKNLCLQ